jgi:hypothetical protein
VDDVRAIEAWTKASQPVSAVQDILTKVSGILNTVFDELRADFNL